MMTTSALMFREATVLPMPSADEASQGDSAVAWRKERRWRRMGAGSRGVEGTIGKPEGAWEASFGRGRGSTWRALV